jgi:hypothetical protein
MSEIVASVTGENQPDVSTSQADGISNFSFAGLHEKALEVFDGGSNTPDPTGLEHVAQPNTPESAPQNVDNASSAQLAQLNPTDLVEVTVDGQKVQMPWSEAQGGVMRQAKFTKEMQALRREQESFGAQRSDLERKSQEHEVLVGLLQNKDMLREFLSKQHPDLLAQATNAAAQEAGLDPDDIATVGQIEAIKRAAEAKVQEAVDHFERRLHEARGTIAQEIQDKSATLKLASEINTTIKGLFEAHPHVVKLTPNAEDMLRFQVSQMKPRTEAEAVEAFKTVFGGWVENFNQVVKDTTKQTVINKQKLVEGNIQPPGGSGPQPQVTDFKTVNKLTGKQDIDWSKLRGMAESMLGK